MFRGDAGGLSANREWLRALGVRGLDSTLAVRT
jgi:hypothetical protein